MELNAYLEFANSYFYIYLHLASISSFVVSYVWYFNCKFSLLDMDTEALIACVEPKVPIPNLSWVVVKVQTMKKKRILHYVAQVESYDSSQEEYLVQPYSGQQKVTVRRTSLYSWISQRCRTVTGLFLKWYRVYPISVFNNFMIIFMLCRKVCYF